MAGFVYWTRPTRQQNRLLALLLFWEAMTHVTAAWRVQFDAWGQTPAAQAANTAFQIGIAISPFLYLLFLGTITVPLTRPLRRRGSRAGIVGLLVATAVGILVVTEITEPFYRRGSPDAVSSGALGLMLVVGLYGLAVATQRHRGTKAGTLQRRQARAYMGAFGGRDLLMILFVVLVLGDSNLWSAGGGSTTGLSILRTQWIPLTWGLVFAGFLTYGILTTQLFDIDLKIKWTLEKSTVAAIFVAVFFVVSEGAQVLFADFAGSELLGVAAAGLLVFFLAPLQQLGEQVSDQVMPGVEDIEAYREQRKREVYRASVEELLADEEITAKERRMLGRLQEELGLDGGEASRIEADVVEASGGEAL